MKVKRYQSNDERSVLTGLIVNDSFLSKVVRGLKGEKSPFESKWSNIIYGWCADYCTKYSKAPRSHIESLLARYANKSHDEESVLVIEKFLSSLDTKYKELARELNEDYLVDVASRHFQNVQLIRLGEKIEEESQTPGGAALEAVQNFRPISFSGSATIHALDLEAWKDALALKEEDVLVGYPDALGEFFGPQLCRDAFIAFLAPEKRGKTFWLLDLAWRAAYLNKRKTLYYSVGDLSARQVMTRFIVRSSRRPIAAAEVTKPKRVSPVVKGEPLKLKTEKVLYKSRISKTEIIAVRKRLKLKSASDVSMFDMVAVPNFTMSASDIEQDLENRAREGTLPDVVVVDYADILAPEPFSSAWDFRHQVNATWAVLRRISQKYHILLVTATQSDALSYDTWLMTRNNFSEDKRKISHVTGMAGINQTEEEKKHGIFRINWLALREGVYYETKYVTCAGNLMIGNPAMKSVW